MSTNNIVHIPLEKLYHNPNNPRQEIGDVSELADSIRGMGILQNLTVCPFDDQIHKGLTVDDPDDSYVVLIGNRRLEAGKEAGIATAPCMLVDLDAAGQMEVMLVENLQRKDLTPVACQDIDRVATMMCYIQLSLLGCPGYVVIADTLSNPVLGDPISPSEQPEQEFWYTPMYYRDCWTMRRMANSMKHQLAG